MKYWIEIRQLNQPFFFLSTYMLCSHCSNLELIKDLILLKLKNIVAILPITFYKVQHEYKFSVKLNAQIFTTFGCSESCNEF